MILIALPSPSLLSVHDANGTPLARLGTLSPLDFHPTLVHHCTRLSRPATPCGALPLVRLCIICGAVWHLCSLPTLMALLRVPRVVSEFPEIHVSVALIRHLAYVLWRVEDSNLLLILSSLGITAAVVGCRSIFFRSVCEAFNLSPYSIFAGLLPVIPAFPSVSLFRSQHFSAEPSSLSVFPQQSSC